MFHGTSARSYCSAETSAQPARSSAWFENGPSRRTRSSDCLALSKSVRLEQDGCPAPGWTCHGWRERRSSAAVAPSGPVQLFDRFFVSGRPATERCRGCRRRNPARLSSGVAAARAPSTASLGRPVARSMFARRNSTSSAISLRGPLPRFAPGRATRRRAGSSGSGCGRAGKRLRFVWPRRRHPPALP